jgi:hypothetical protein
LKDPNLNAVTDKPGEKIKRRKGNLSSMNPLATAMKQFEAKFDYLNLKMKRLIPTRSIFNFLKAKPTETKVAESNGIQKLTQAEVQIKQEETKLLWNLYEPKEEEGLQQFDTSLTN